MDKKQKKVLIQALKSMYPDASSELNFDNPYQLIVAVMLSAQCTDKKVNEVTTLLFEKFPSFTALKKARLSQLETLLRPINYYKTKAKNLLNTAKEISNRGGSLPASRQELESLPGVGRKTASVVLGELGIEPSLPVDTHVYRLARRLGLSKALNRDRLEEDLRRQFAPSEWRALHHMLIYHGRRVCKAVRPLCSECRLSAICPSSRG
jgi:endonuclease-3